MKVVVVGSGYVGLVSGACIANWGNQVVCVDKDAGKIAGLNQGRIPIFEPDLAQLVLDGTARQCLTFTTDLARALQGADIVMIAVGTPPHPSNGEADLSFVYAAAKEIALAMTGFTVVVTKSTVPVGTGDEITRIISSTRPEADFAVVSNPEFLREGSAVADFFKPDRVVIGSSQQRAIDLMERLYSPLTSNGVPLVKTARRTAELIKYAANAFLAVKISFINEIADLCEKIGSDVQQVARGIGLDSRIGASFLQAGPGYGGSCFPKDTMALLRTSQNYGVSLRLVEETIAVNEARKRRMALKVIDALDGSVDGKTIAVLGLTFKANTDDVRESPAFYLIESLRRMGANIKACDPEGLERARSYFQDDITLVPDPYACVMGAHAVVLATDWPSYKNLDFDRLGKVMARKALVDLRNAVDVNKALVSGFSVSSVGSPTIERRTISNAELTVPDNLEDSTGASYASRPPRGAGVASVNCEEKRRW